MDKDNKALFKKEAKSPYFVLLKIVGLILMLYFAFQMVEKGIVAVDLAGPNRGVTVPVGEKTVSVPTLIKNEDGEYAVAEQEVTQTETLTLHGPSAWSAFYATWLSTNAIYLALGAIFYGAWYVMSEKRSDRISASLLKLKLLGMMLSVVAIVIIVNGTNRIFFLPHEPLQGFLYKLDWYVAEYLNYIVWGLVLAAIAVFFIYTGRHSVSSPSEEGADGIS